MAKISEYKSAALKLGSLYITGAKLKTTEIAVSLISALVLGAIALIIAAIAVFFVSVGAAFQLAQFMDPIYAFIIVGALYLLLLVTIWAFRRTLIVDPLSRILSRIILSNPINTDEDETDSPE